MLLQGRRKKEKMKAEYQQIASEWLDKDLTITDDAILDSDGNVVDIPKKYINKFLFDYQTRKVKNAAIQANQTTHETVATTATEEEPITEDKTITEETKVVTPPITTTTNAAKVTTQPTNAAKTTTGKTKTKQSTEVAEDAASAVLNDLEQYWDEERHWYNKPVLNRRYPNDLGFRLNNPGNLRPFGNYLSADNPDRRVWTSPTNPDNQFRIFRTPQEGFDALVNDMRIKARGESDVVPATATLQEMINVYAPAEDNNDPTSYANTVATDLGITTSTPINTLTNKQLMDLAKAIVRVESPNSYIELFGR